MSQFVYLGGLAWVVGIAVALALATTRPRTGGLAALAVVLAVAVVLYAFFSAPTDPTKACSDCGKYLGRWWEPRLVAAILGANVVAWVVGVLMGAVARRAAGERRSRR